MHKSAAYCLTLVLLMACSGPKGTGEAAQKRILEHPLAAVRGDLTATLRPEATEERTRHLTGELVQLPGVPLRDADYQHRVVRVVLEGAASQQDREGCEVASCVQVPVGEDPPSPDLDELHQCGGGFLCAHGADAGETDVAGVDDAQRPGGEPAGPASVAAAEPRKGDLGALAPARLGVGEGLQGAGQRIQPRVCGFLRILRPPRCNLVLGPVPFPPQVVEAPGDVDRGGQGIRRPPAETLGSAASRMRSRCPRRALSRASPSPLRLHGAGRHTRPGVLRGS